MNAEWWEGLSRFMCGYWWILLIIIVMALTALFLSGSWLPALLAAFGLL